MTDLAFDLPATLRELAPRVLAAAARRSGDFAAAEDAVQEALLAASREWPERGAPENPAGWLYHVALRRLSDSRDSDRARARREQRVARERIEAVPHEIPEFTAGDEDLLELFVLCCHPELNENAAVPLVLRALGGLTTAEIACALFSSEATIAQRISRAKDTLRDAGIEFAPPAPERRAARLGSVLRVLYLVFNEGYTASSGASLARVDLSFEAIRLARAVHRAAPEDPEAEGLLALLLLTDARRVARTGPDGELVPLHEQDRGRWDRDAIAEGVALVTRAFSRGKAGPYQIQAAIAALHDEAPSVEATDWKQILALYSILARFGDNPAVTLNRAVAVAMVEGDSAGLAALEPLSRDPRVATSHRLAAVRAHLLERRGERAAARAEYLAAAGRTSNLAERRYLERKAAALASS